MPKERMKCPQCGQSMTEDGYGNFVAYYCPCGYLMRKQKEPDISPAEAIVGLKALKVAYENIQGEDIRFGGYKVPDICEAVIPACEKQDPIAPITYESDTDAKIGRITFRAGTTVEQCPACNGLLLANYKYCPNCGQKIKR